jgi:DNA helicase II / ATP-dependent DNA helicase PcrA
MLNAEQQAAVEHKQGPLLIVAGAGTGKTTVITERIKWLITQGLAKPEEILALTFTEKAAREMEDRVDRALPYGVFGMWVSTFHSFCDRILRSEALHIGLSPHYKLLSEAEAYLLVKKNFWKFELKNFRPSGNPYKFIDGMVSHFSRLKDEDIKVGEYKNKEYPELEAAYKTYEDLKTAEEVMDFSDLISNTLRLLRERKAVLNRYRGQFHYILVDEFQDTNLAQYELIKLLAPAKANLTVVGDDSQSIYKFRGAAISNILSFMKDYPKAKQIVLTKNYRSTQTILDSAYQLIKHNDPDTLEARLGINKNLVSQVENGPAIELVYADRVETEAEEVIKKIEGPDFKDYAILVRANNHAEPFVRALERAKIPFQFLGPGMLYRQPEVKDLIAYLKVLADFTDSVSLYRVLSMDLWGISQRDLIYLLNNAKKKNISLFEELESLTGVIATLSPGEIATSLTSFAPRNDTIAKFVSMVHRHQELVPKETGGQILYYFLQDSGLLKKVVDYETAVQEREALNITKFFDRLKSFEATNADASIFAIVEYLDLAMNMGESPLAAETDWAENNAVNILTVHSAKGLEFPVVFLTNLVDGRFPSRERREQIPVPAELIKEILPVGDYHLEEERRLFYVGMTRAKRRLIFSAANFYGEGKRERKLSPFVTEAGVNPSLVIGHSQQQIPLFEWAKPTENEKREASSVKIDYLSYSAIQAFEDCPLHFKMRYILRVPTPPTAPLSMGSSIHLALRDFYRDKSDLLDYLRQNWITEGYQSKKHEAEALKKAEEFLKNYLSCELHKNAKPIYLEQSFSFKINDLKIGGKIDRIDDAGDGMVEIIDYKSGKKTKDADDGLQLTIYALAATEQFSKPVDRIKLSYYFLEDGEKVTSVRTIEQLEDARKHLLAIRDEIEKSDFACSGSLLCKNCEFKMLCG